MRLNNILYDNREESSFGLPHKKLPVKKFGVNWFPNLERNETEEEYISNMFGDAYRRSAQR